MKLLEAEAPAPLHRDAIECIMDTVCQQGPPGGALSPVVTACLLAMVEKCLRRCNTPAAERQPSTDTVCVDHATTTVADTAPLLQSVAIWAGSLCAIPSPALPSVDDPSPSPIAAQLGAALGDVLHRLAVAKRRAATKQRAQEEASRRVGGSGMPPAGHAACSIAAVQHGTSQEKNVQDRVLVGQGAVPATQHTSEQAPPGKRRRVQPEAVCSGAAGGTAGNTSRYDDDAWDRVADDKDPYAGNVQGMDGCPLRWWEDDAAWAQYIAGKEQLVKGLLKDDVLQYDTEEQARAAAGGGGHSVAAAKRTVWCSIG